MAPFDDSRRLTGCNLFFAATGAVLEALEPVDAALLAAWRARIERAQAHLGWGERGGVARRHAKSTSLALRAPCDQLFLATEVNEWALCAATAELAPARRDALEAALIAKAIEAAENAGDPPPEPAPVLEESAAFARFRLLAGREAIPALRPLIEAAAARGLPHTLDETLLTLGAGAGGRSFPVTDLPDAAAVPWNELADIPTALVTGSNGKTTTVRLIAACARAHGWPAGYNCTDGVFVGEETLATGDYSGPAGARLVMRDARTRAAILETARGGILRRGIAVSRADVAVVTNVSADHFGEYGIDDLAGLADAKLSVAGVVKPDGLVVLNADDAQLRARASELASRFGRTPTLGWFAIEDAAGFLRAQRARGVPVCTVQDGHLRLDHAGVTRDLGAVRAMPLSIEGLAGYNIANLAAAALGATGLGIPGSIIAEVFARFGARAADNPGRMMRFESKGARALVDYAHNPDGMRGFLAVARGLPGGRRLAVTLGQAGNRSNADIEELVRVTAQFHPDLVIVTENEAYLRGRALGEVPAIIRAELARCAIPDSAIRLCGSELEAVRCALDWALPGDVLALAVHSLDTRAAVIAMLEAG